ncbi:MAG: HlyD family type I secretion periplasmic adaptor subunit [Minwuia sp.]|uniref:HlyD family type I secretion periplasmic adaptor subunit n=1 Tax=Minwuia sp. TaxID=2493630 RepID=UPI003A8C6869
MTLGQLGAAPSQGPLDREPKLGIGKLVLIGGLVIAAFFLGLGGWAVFVPLTSAAIAQGQVTVDGRRKTIQHLEGGIVRDIPVSEGDLVDKGDVLLVLDDIRAKSDVELLRGRLGVALAARSRLAAERDRSEGVAFPEELERLIGNETERLELIEGELTVFEERRNFLQSQTKINRQRIEQLKSEIAGLRDEVVALNRQLLLIGEEEQGLSGLVEKGLARKPQLLALQRQQADLNGELARNKAAIARAQQQIGETELTILDIRTRFLNEVVGRLQEVQAEIADLRDRMSAADDVIRRTEVRAPVRGIVVNKQVNTTGGVISPGQPLMDIVPVNGGLTVEARVSPADIDVVHQGLPAQVRIAAFKIAENPILEGSVRTVSADALQDERTGETFYVAQIELKDLSPLPPGAELQPGMPAEVMIVTGEQTPLQYLLEPIRISIRRAMRES